VTSLGELAVEEPQLRVIETEGRWAVDTVRGMTATQAIVKLRFGPGRTCEAVARLIERGVANAERAGVSTDHLIVVGGDVQPGEEIVRVRRKAHGKADWISSPTSQVRIELLAAGLHASGMRLRPGDRHGPAAGLVADGPLTGGPAATEDEPAASPPPEDPRGQKIRDTLYDVIDPDLGVNIVDLGFVRAIEIDGDTAVITMTLTSPACPLAGTMEDQIRTQLVAERRIVSDVRVNWVWVPAWRPDDISEDGRWQLTAIGFSF
jgi:metal-sulfur cluster biosynthetic enzyme/ribosomal protein L22